MNKLSMGIHDFQAAIQRHAVVYELRQFGQTIDITPRKDEVDKVYKEAVTMDILIYDYARGTKRVARSKRGGKEVYPVQ